MFSRMHRSERTQSSLLEIAPLLLWLAGPLGAEGLHTRLSQIDLDKFPEVSVVLNVFTEKGQPVPGLTKDSFSLAEDGKEVQILSVDIDRAPLSLALVLDTSGSMEPAMEDLRRSVSAFIRALRNEDRILFVPFADRPYGGMEITKDRRKILDEVVSFQASGATALYDAIQKAVKGLRHESGMRLAVIFTDGRDQNAEGTDLQSITTARGVVEEARERQIPLWTIGLGEGVDKKLLHQMAVLTGGQSYRPSRAGQLRSAFGQLLKDVRLRYRLSYGTPLPERDGSERQLAVTSSSQGKKGQGQARYLAPAKEEPPVVVEPPATAEREDGSEARVIRVESQETRVIYAGFPSEYWVLAWPTENPTPTHRDRSDVISLPVRKDVVLPAGRWSLGFFNPMIHPEIGWLATVDLSGGDEMYLLYPGLPGDSTARDLDLGARVLPTSMARVTFKGFKGGDTCLTWPSSTGTPESKHSPGVIWRFGIGDVISIVLEPGEWVFGTVRHLQDNLTALAQATLAPDDHVVIEAPAGWKR